MPDYILSNAAKQDLKEIARFGDERFGPQKSDEYREALKEKFQKIADQPFLFQAVEHIHEDYRRCVHGSHSIYYRVNGGLVEIMRILGQQDTRNL